MKDKFGKNIQIVSGHTPIEIKTKLKHGDIPLIHNKQIFNLPYFVNSGAVNTISAKIDNDTYSVLATITCDEETEIGITLPRKLIDAKEGLKDDDFFVLINNEEVGFQEESDEKERTVTISLYKGINYIEIIGNQLRSISIGGATIFGNKIRILPKSSIPHDGKYLEPEVLKIKQGDTVTWSNDDTAAHTITSGAPFEGTTGMFDSGLFMSDETYKIKFNNKGTFDYFCMVHPWKTGKIIVK